MRPTRILLAPGASGPIDRLRPHAEGLEGRGFAAELVPLPRSSAERALPHYRSALAAHDAATTAIGGHSFGGRVASLLAAEVTPAALVLLSYPLHAPGRHDDWERRTAHWPRIDCPVLLLSGTADPFARIDLLERAAGRLPRGRLAVYPGLRHGLAPRLDAVLDEISTFLDAV